MEWAVWGRSFLTLQGPWGSLSIYYVVELDNLEVSPALRICALVQRSSSLTDDRGPGVRAQVCVWGPERWRRWGWERTGLWQRKMLSLVAGQAGASPGLWRVCRAPSSVSLIDHPAMPLLG